MLFKPIAFKGGNGEPAEGMTVTLSNAQAGVGAIAAMIVFPLLVGLLLAGVGYFPIWGAQASCRAFRRFVCFGDLVTPTFLPTPVRTPARKGRSASSHSAIKASNWAKSNGFCGV